MGHRGPQVGWGPTLLPPPSFPKPSLQNHWARTVPISGDTKLSPGPNLSRAEHNVSLQSQRCLEEALQVPREGGTKEAVSCRVCLGGASWSLNRAPQTDTRAQSPAFAWSEVRMSRCTARVPTCRRHRPGSCGGCGGWHPFTPGIAALGSRRTSNTPRKETGRTQFHIIFPEFCKPECHSFQNLCLSVSHP